MKNELQRVSEKQIETKPASVPHFLTRENRTLLNRIEIVFFKTLAYIFWGYALISTFVFSIDAALRELIPTPLHWAVDYKLLVFLGALVASIALLPRGRLSCHIPRDCRRAS